MRCEPLNGSLSAEESVEPITGQAEFLSGRLRLCTRNTHPWGFGCPYPPTRVGYPGPTRATPIKLFKLLSQG